MHAAPPVQNLVSGIMLRVGAATSFAFMAAMIKLGHENGVTMPELVFYRFAFGLPPLFAWIVWTGDYGAWRTERPLAHLTRGVLGLTTMALAFSALAFLPLAEATTISFVAPLFSVILSAVLLREKVGPYRWSAVLAGFAGMLIVMRPGNGDLPLAGLTLALLAAIGVAAVTITIRQIGKTESTQTTVLWFSGLSMLISGTMLPFFAEMHDVATWAILAALGLFGGLGQLFLTSSLRFAPVSAVVPFDYTQLLWAVLLGWILFGSEPPGATWAGAALIIGSGLFTLWRERQLGLAEKRRTAEMLRP